MGLNMEGSRGFSLIEVLVTLVLISIGILGMMTLQSKSIQFTQDSANRNFAITLADDLIEIMRSHRDDFYNNKPPLSYLHTELKNVTAIYNSDGTLKFNSDSCPSTRIPQSLLEQASCWLQIVENNLPGTTDENIKNKIKICPGFKIGKCAGSSYKGSSLTLQLAWDAKQGECFGGEDETICTYITRIEL